MTGDTPAPQRCLHVTQGQYEVSDRPQDVLVTVLGSCIATCLTDPVAGVGGMNHFLLPGEASQRGRETRYGINAMELLINAILKAGGQIGRLEAKVFGGAHTAAAPFAIGQANAEFAFWFLRNEGIRCIGQDVGGARARKLRYWPATGQAQQMRLDVSSPPVRPRPAAVTGENGSPPGELDLL